MSEKKQQDETILIHLVYFGWLAERMGCRSEFRDVVRGGSVEEFLESDLFYPVETHEKSLLQVAFERIRVSRRFILNVPGELAFFPPVSGG